MRDSTYFFALHAKRVHTDMIASLVFLVSSYQGHIFSILRFTLVCCDNKEAALQLHTGYIE